jgi:pyridoxamine 5'-phosphate oxidase-like protein
MSVLNSAARDAVTGGHLAHLVTINPDGSPQVSVVWVGLDGEEIVSGHMGERQKLRNVRRDARVVLSMQTGVVNDMGLHPPGLVLRITPERVSGVGPWSDPA